MIKSQALKEYHLPDAPGVYFFKQNKAILYIGKATSLKDRVKSYFSHDLISTRGPLLVDMLYKANKIDFIKTESVLEAIILEANLIKKYQPKYNTKEKDNKSFNYVVITKEDFPRVLIIRGRNIKKIGREKARTNGLADTCFLTREDIRGPEGEVCPDLFNISYGPYTNSTQLKEALKIIRKMFPFRDRCVPLSGKPCFNKQLGLCPGVCDGSITKKEYAGIIRKIKLIFSGKIRNLKAILKNEMTSLSKKREYEKAGEIKRQIFALEHISDVSLISDSSDRPGYQNNHPALSKAGKGKGMRIEAYDVAHLSGTNNVGVMVVRQLTDGESNFKKSDYRKFKIQNSVGNDIGALKEILERRIRHLDWPKADLIVVDGGLAQFNIAKSVVKNIPIMAVTKDDKHKAKAIIGDENVLKNLSRSKYSDTLLSGYKKEILLINNEAHRFAIAFHRQKRSMY